MSREQKLAKIDEMRAKMVDKETGEPVMRSMTECDRGIKVFSTRVPSLDIALGVGGVPRGRVSEFFGPERGGKTTLALQTAASCQEEGGIILYVDSEHALDIKYCMSLGLDVEDPGFIIVQEDTADKALDAALALIEQGTIDMLIIDSLANLIPATTYDKVVDQGVGSAVIGSKAKLQTQFIEAAIGKVHRDDIAMFNVQQMRTIMKPGQTPRDDSATQAASMRHNTSVRVKVSRKGDNEGTGRKTDETYVGESQESIARVTKNKVAPPFRQALYTVAYGKGALYWDDLLDSCIVHGVEGVSFTSMFQIVDTETGETYPKFYRKKAEEFFRKNPEVGTMLVDKLSDAVGIHLWDPIRGSRGRRIGPYTIDEIEAVGGTVIDCVDFEESADDPVGELTLDDLDIVAVL
jgi:recombination protein RecA